METRRGLGMEIAVAQAAEAPISIPAETVSGKALGPGQAVGLPGDGGTALRRWDCPATAASSRNDLLRDGGLTP